ncbi:hypothetical protein [Streptomyces sp. NPDC050988]|uniref:hypothetical protein n=1 Tax=Streptomyces sp. NPDC050988 TaxID=3365637 RepID=UPI0037AC01EB
MTTVHATPVPAQQAAAVDVWSTSVWLGTIRPVLDHDLLRAQMHLTGQVAREIAPQSLLDVAQARSVFTTLAQTVLPHDVGSEVRVAVQIWGAGHRIPLAYGHGAWTAWCYLAVDGQPPHDRSGALCLHDPRAGCDAASVPGLPWGRAVTLKAQAGLTALAPGWLAHSVLPVSPCHTLAVLTAQADSTPTGGAPP